MRTAACWLWICAWAIATHAHAELLQAPRPQALAVDVYSLPGAFAPGEQPDGNSTLLRGPKGWIVFDSGRHPEHMLRLLDFARASRLPIVALVNSHWHLDHIGGNARFRSAVPGLRVYASAAVERALGTWLADYRSQLEGMLADPKLDSSQRASYRSEVALIDSGRQLLPDITIRATRNWQLAGRPLRIGLVNDAVTAGDLWLYDRNSRTLLAGDLVTFPVPFFDTACPEGWQRALHQLADTLAFKRMVPGHGPLLTRGDFTAYVTAFDSLLSCAASTQSAAQCSDNWLSATAAFVPASEHARAREMLDYYFSQRLRAPQAERERFCPPSEQP